MVWVSLNIKTKIGLKVEYLNYNQSNPLLDIESKNPQLEIDGGLHIYDWNNNFEEERLKKKMGEYKISFVIWIKKDKFKTTQKF